MLAEALTNGLDGDDDDAPHFPLTVVGNSACLNSSVFSLFGESLSLTSFSRTLLLLNSKYLNSLFSCSLICSIRQLLLSRRTVHTSNRMMGPFPGDWGLTMMSLIAVSDTELRPAVTLSARRSMAPAGPLSEMSMGRDHWQTSVDQFECRHRRS